LNTIRLNQGDKMNLTYKIGLVSSLTVGSFFAFTAQPSLAQSQSFSQCVMELYRGPYSKTDAANNCLNAFRGRPVNEEFSTCISTLYQGPYSKTDSNNYCQQAFANSSYSPSGNPSSNQSNGSTIIVVPQNQSTNSQPQRNARRQCVHTWFNQVWDDIHCQYNNGMFEWRTVYY
jgi:hypothetical protein